MSVLMDDLAAQVVAVDRRVAAAGAYTHESDEVRVAAEQVPLLQRRLNLGQYLGSLTPPTGKPQYLLEFESSDTSSACRRTSGLLVLKVYGRSRPGEAELQGRWSCRGLPTPRIYDYDDSPVSWLLMERIAGGPLATPSSREQSLALTREVAEVMARVHAEGDLEVRGARPLRDAVLPHLEVVVAALLRHAYSVPHDWRTRASRAYGAGRPVSLHGDLFTGNMLRTSDMRLLLVDACAYLGDASFDAGRWAVRLATVDCPPEMLLHTWLKVENLDPAVATALLGAECLMQAGVREIVKDEQGRPFSDRDELTLGLVAAFDRSCRPS